MARKAMINKALTQAQVLDQGSQSMQDLWPVPRVLPGVRSLQTLLPQDGTRREASGRQEG